MQIIVTLAGLGQRFKEEGYSKPKPLVDVLGQPAIYHLIKSFSLKWKLIFVIGEQYRASELESIIKKISPECKIIFVPYSERGPIDTVAAAIPYLDWNESVVISYCDYSMVWDPMHFEQYVEASDCDAAVLSYRGFHPTYLGPNTYAHMLVDQNSQEITQIQEKKLFGNDLEAEWSSAGFYYFRSVELLKEGMRLQTEKVLKYKNEFYTSLAIQALIEESPKFKKLKIVNYEIPFIVQMGTPEDIRQIEKWHQRIILDGPKTTEPYSGIEKKLFDYWSAVFSSTKVELDRAENQLVRS